MQEGISGLNGAECVTSLQTASFAAGTEPFANVRFRTGDECPLLAHSRRQRGTSTATGPFMKVAVGVNAGV
jgi:hypothetical protein